MRLLVGAVLASFLLASAPAPGEDPYVAFVRSPEGTRLLAIARESMRAHWGDRSPRARAETIPWPASPRGIYITLTDGNGTRACVGNAAPYRGSLVETVRALA